jgi:hypothetical protein
MGLSQYHYISLVGGGKMGREEHAQNPTAVDFVSSTALPWPGHIIWSTPSLHGGDSPGSPCNVWISFVIQDACTEFYLCRNQYIKPVNKASFLTKPAHLAAHKQPPELHKEQTPQQSHRVYQETMGLKNTKRQCGSHKHCSRPPFKFYNGSESTNNTKTLKHISQLWRPSWRQTLGHGVTEEATGRSRKVSASLLSCCCDLLTGGTRAKVPFTWTEALKSEGLKVTQCSLKCATYSWRQPPKFPFPSGTVCTCCQPNSLSWFWDALCCSPSYSSPALNPLEQRILLLKWSQTRGWPLPP